MTRKRYSNGMVRQVDGSCPSRENKFDFPFSHCVSPKIAAEFFTRSEKIFFPLSDDHRRHQFGDDDYGGDGGDGCDVDVVYLKFYFFSAPFLTFTFT